MLESMVTDILSVVLKVRSEMGVVKRVIVGAVKRDVRRRKDILANVKFYNRAGKGCGFLCGCEERADGMRKKQWRWDADEKETATTR